eukprot:EG_transcript_5603
MPAPDKMLADKDLSALLLEAAAAEGCQPPEDPAEYEEWFGKVTARMMQQAVEEGHLQGKNEDGTMWCMVSPKPAFVVKAKNNLSKVFVNICSSDKIREPQPLGDVTDETQDIQWRVPLSCGTARLDKDKEGVPCVVYDVIYNTGTLERAAKEPDFKQLVIALALQYLKQKSEPELSAAWSLPKMRSKGEPALQRIRMDAPVTVEPTLGDSDVRLPEGELSATRTAPRHSGPLITELDDHPQQHQSKSEAPSPNLPTADGPTHPVPKAPTPAQPSPHRPPVTTVDYQPTMPDFAAPGPASPAAAASGTPATPPASATPVGQAEGPAAHAELEHQLECQGSFDWVAHGMEAPAGDQSPAVMVLDIRLPPELAMKDVGTDIQAWRVQVVHTQTRQRLLGVDLPFMANEDESAGKFFRKRHVLQVTMPVDAVKQAQLAAQRQQRELPHAHQLETEAAAEAARARALHSQRLLEHEQALQAEQEEAEAKRRQDAEAAAEAQAREALRQAKGEAALQYAAQSAERATEVRRRAMERLRGSAPAAPEEPPGQDTGKDKFESTTYGFTPKRMKDLFGVEFKNRYLFALDTDM